MLAKQLNQSIGRPLVLTRHGQILNSSAERNTSSVSYLMNDFGPLSNPVYLASTRLTDISTRCEAYQVTAQTSYGRLSEQLQKCKSNCVSAVRGRDLIAEVGWGAVLEELYKSSTWDQVKPKTNVLGQTLLLIGSDAAERKFYKDPAPMSIRPVPVIDLIQTLVGTKAFDDINDVAIYKGGDKVEVDMITSVLKDAEFRMAGVTQFDTDEHRECEHRFYRLLYECGQVKMASDSDALFFPIRDKTIVIKKHLVDSFTLYDHPSPFSQFVVKTVFLESEPSDKDYYSEIVKLSEWALHYQPCNELDIEKNLSPRVILLFDLGHSENLRVARFRIPYHPKTVAIVIRGLNPADMVPYENQPNFWFNKLKESLH